MTPSRREAADPTMVVYKGEYYLFASKSGGYFHSTDLINWDLILLNDLTFGRLCPNCSSNERYALFYGIGYRLLLTIYKTVDPKSGKWQVGKP
jgi:xylan 1,4-beta-xylosidase